MSNGLLHSTIKSGTLADRPTAFPGDYDIAFYYATDTDTLYTSKKPAVGSTTVDWRIAFGGDPVVLGDADATIAPADSGKPHIIANVSADRTFTLPALADGLDFLFIASVGGADGHDWIFATAATDELFAGGLLVVDTDAAPALASAVVADQSNDDALQVNVPQGGTWVRITSNGTHWVVSGTVLATAVPAFS